MKIALLHNYMDNIGGAEIVTLTFARELNADIYTTLINSEHIANVGFADVLPRIYSVGKIPKQAPFKQQLAFWKFRRLNLGKKYDFYIISGDWAMSGAVKNKPNLWYAHSPLNEIWQFKDNVRKEIVIGWKHPLFDLWVWFNRKLTLSYARHVECWVCNSHNTKNRIQRFYGKEATVIYPPIDTGKYKKSIGSKKDSENSDSGKYWLSVNRLVNHKRIEMQLDAFAQLPNEKLIIVGSYEKDVHHFEKYRAELDKRKPSNVTFKYWVSDAELTKLYSECKGFITTARDEDFGMTAVEAMAAGKIVIAPNEGGYKESVLDGLTGLLIDDITSKKLAMAIQKAEEMPKKSSQIIADECRRQSEHFDQKKSTEDIKKILKKKQSENNYNFLRVTNNLTGTQPMIFHEPGDPSQRPKNKIPELRQSILSAPPQKIGCPSDLTIITWNNHSDSVLEETCRHLGIPLIVYGKEIKEWKSNYETKRRILYEACQKIQTPYIMGLDSKDALFLDSPFKILEEFKLMKIGMLFGGELCFNGGFYKKTPELNEFMKSQAKKDIQGQKSPFTDLNSGQWIAEKTPALLFFEKALAYPCEPEMPFSDQAVLARTLAENNSFHSNIKIDYQCKIFQVYVGIPGIFSFTKKNKESSGSIKKILKLKAETSYLISDLKPKLDLNQELPVSKSIPLKIDSWKGKIGIRIKKTSPQLYFFLRSKLHKKKLQVDQKEIIAQAKTALLKTYEKYSDLGIMSIYLWGSITRNDFEYGKSDIDVLVIIYNPINQKELNRIKKFAQHQLHWLDKFNISSVTKSELDGKTLGESKKSGVMRFYSPEALPVTFNTWQLAAGKELKLSDLGTTPYSDEELIGYQKAVTLRSLLQKNPKYQEADRLAVKKALWLCYFMDKKAHKKNGGDHAYDVNTFVKYQTKETQSIIPLLFSIKNSPHYLNDLMLHRKKIVDFVKSVKATYPNRYLKSFFEEILLLFKKNNIDYWVIGGIAVSALAGNFLREHKDIDICVKEGDFKKISDIIKKMCEKRHADWHTIERWQTEIDRPKIDLLIDGIERLSIIPIYEVKNGTEIRIAGKVLFFAAKMEQHIKKIGDFVFCIPQRQIIIELVRSHIITCANKFPEKLLDFRHHDSWYWIDVDFLLGEKEYNELYEKAEHHAALMGNKFFQKIDASAGFFGICINKISPKTYQFLKSHMKKSA